MTSSTTPPPGRACTCRCRQTNQPLQSPAELITDVEERYPQEWLAFVIPPGENEYTPEQGILVAHSRSDTEVCEVVNTLPAHQLVHVYFNGTIENYLKWLDQ